jgi:hypothetical protein
VGWGGVCGLIHKFCDRNLSASKYPMLKETMEISNTLYVFRDLCFFFGKVVGLSR